VQETTSNHNLVQTLPSVGCVGESFLNNAALDYHGAAQVYDITEDAFPLFRCGHVDCSGQSPFSNTLEAI